MDILQKKNDYLVEIHIYKLCDTPIVVVLTCTLVTKAESVVIQRCRSPRKIRKSKYNQNSSGKHYSFPPKTHDTNKGAQVKGSNVQTELTWPRVSSQLQHRVLPFPHLFNSRLQTTAVGLPAPYEPHCIVSTGERACSLECCQSDDPRGCSETRAIALNNNTMQIPVSMITPPSRVI